MIRYIDRAEKECRENLFGILAALARDEITSFPALRPHQRQAWHCFLVQAGALALLRGNDVTLPEGAADWRDKLLALTPDHPGGEAWQLVVDDWSKPALLQPPGMSAPGSKGNKIEYTPDAIDMLVTGRNHDLKGERIGAAEADEWLFALVTLQTLEGQMGAPNFGISRMNGGYGARVHTGIRLLPDGWGKAVRRDIETLLDESENLSAMGPMSGDLGLVWTVPWDGTKSLGAGTLHPLYIDCCRRVRLQGGQDTPRSAVLASSKTARIDAKALNGVTGDPWAPVLADGSKSWGISRSGFGYRQMTTLLSTEETTLPLLARIRSSDGKGPMVFHAVAMTRGMGKTEGFHERRLLLPPKAVRRFGRAEGRQRVADEAVARREAAGDAQKILRHALFALYQGGPDKARLDDDATGAKATEAVSAFDAAVDRIFFGPDFWEAIAPGDSEDTDSLDRARQWRMRLQDVAEGILQRAQEAAPRTHMRYHRAVARSSSLLRARMRRFVDPAGDDGDDPASGERTEQPERAA